MCFSCIRCHISWSNLTAERGGTEVDIPMFEQASQYGCHSCYAWACNVVHPLRLRQMAFVAQYF